MTRIVIVSVLCFGLMSACARVSESRLNPFNWFGEDEEITVSAPAEVPTDPRPLIAEVTALAVERTSTGAIVRATGLPPVQGWYGAELVPERSGPVDGTMVYRFRAVPPDGETPVSTPQSRELTVAAFLTPGELANIRAIQVIGASNVRSVRR